MLLSKPFQAACPLCRRQAIPYELGVVRDAGGQDVVVEVVVAAVQGRASFPGGCAVADEGEARRYVTGEDAEVLAGHDGIAVGVDAVGSQGCGGRGRCPASAVGVVDGRGELMG